MDFKSLVKSLLCVDEVDNVGLVRRVLEATSLDLICLVLAVLRKLCVLVRKLFLQACLCVLNGVGELDDLTLKTLLISRLVVQRSMAVLALRIAPGLLLVVSFFLLS